MPPPPLPARSGPPPLPIRDAHALRSNFAIGSKISTRDVARGTGKLFGDWVNFDSTNVMRAKYEPNVDSQGNRQPIGTIWIEFVSGAEYKYRNRPAGDFMDLVESSSKGRFSYYEVRGEGPSHKGMGLWKPCEQTRQAWRSKAEQASIRKKRQPVGAKQQQRTYTRGGKRRAFGAGGKRLPSVH